MRKQDFTISVLWKFTLQQEKEGKSLDGEEGEEKQEIVADFYKNNQWFS